MTKVYQKVTFCNLTIRLRIVSII